MHTKLQLVGDTVGDPFKDTSGPSMNILIKLTCLVGLVIAPILGGHTSDSHATNEVKKEIKVEMKSTEGETAMVTSTENNEEAIKNSFKKVKQAVEKNSITEEDAKKIAKTIYKKEVEKQKAEKKE